MKVLVIDGYNVIHAIPELESKLDASLEAAREALIGRCQALKAARGDIGEIQIVFDGQGDLKQAPMQRGTGISVLFTPEREEADDRILRLIKAAGRGMEFVIVSDDNYVFNNSRAHGAKAVGVAEFARWLKPKSGRMTRSPGAVESKTLSGRQKQEITEAYRQELERRGKS
jgi:uncharacterized protein